ncbi:hypothetical protein ICW40_01175 [Actinotalea ferrariae]|uniref:hypothetical protein n=1 Tax=Actinotalea ferrariae TaxID=1386098 RepID=UPI001C8C526F|nr:hypothetical protein [Actinotalea ferrariae]MBX9243417.1 hypothetical protein [Actinotalea ferrariae]
MSRPRGQRAATRPASDTPVTSAQSREAAVMAVQGETDERIAEHLGLDVEAVRAARQAD